MAFIKFNNRTSPVEAQAKKLNNHRIQIIGCAVNTSGFLYYQDKEMKRLYGVITLDSLKRTNGVRKMR